jgi:hypothetical protein
MRHSLLHIHSFGLAGGKLNKSQNFIPNVVIGKISLLHRICKMEKCSQLEDDRNSNDLVHKEVFQASKVSDEVFVSDAECSFNKARV